jgi:hypothetical protein
MLRRLKLVALQPVQLNCPKRQLLKCNSRSLIVFLRTLHLVSVEPRNSSLPMPCSILNTHMVVAPKLNLSLLGMSQRLRQRAHPPLARSEMSLSS